MHGIQKTCTGGRTTTEWGARSVLEPTPEVPTSWLLSLGHEIKQQRDVFLVSGCYHHHSSI